MPKLKSSRGAAKRFRVTKNKKFKHAKAKRRHIMECKSPKKSQDLRKKAYVHSGDIKHVKQLLPYA